MSASWLFKMAWRDSRKNTGRLLLFTGSILLGIAALVAINSFSYNLKNQIDLESKELLGADLEVQSRQPIPDEIYSLFDSLDLELSREISFASMIYFPKSDGTRLVSIRALEVGFPFYGELGTLPANAQTQIDEGQNTLIDKSLMLQYGASVGEIVKVGTLQFKIAGEVISIPGQTALMSGVAPPVFIPYKLVNETGLLKKGSRINYRAHIKYPDQFDEKTFKEIIKPRLEKADLRYTDVAERKKDIGEGYSSLAGFLNLTAFVALLLGCIGVASSAQIYIKGKVNSIAVLRCLGATGNQAMWIYLIQIAFMSLIGSVAGAILGSASQFLLPGLFNDFLPFEVSLSISWASVFQGVGLGVLIAILFAMSPLLDIKKISPLKVLRASYEAEKAKGHVYVVALLILVLIYLFTAAQLKSWWGAFVFTIGLVIAFGLLSGLAKLTMWLIRKYFPVKRSMIFRQSLSNLYRPNNQTAVLIVSIGLGTALIATLLLSQDMLLNKIEFSSKTNNRPNMVLFDIQDDQIDSLKKFTEDLEVSAVGSVPIVNMRLHTIRGMSVEDVKADTSLGISDRIVNREYRVTYRDSLIDSETLIKGSWQERVENQGDSIFISLADNIAEDMLAEIGDPIAFNVQGAIIQTYVGSIREVDWQRIQTNFLVVFPEGVLEEAPKFHVLLARYDSLPQSASYQNQVINKFPNISIIDLSLVIETIDQIISRVSFVIRFMAFLSILTGLIVLIGSIMLSKFQRIRESVLLRTLGANKFQILSINALEFFFLGSLASLSGILIALVSSWVLSWYSFDTIFAPQFAALAFVYIIITGITVLIGLSNSRQIIRKSPLEILRQEM